MLYFAMNNFLKELETAKQEDKELFYNSAGSKQAYQLGIKHISATEFLGFSLKLPDEDLRITRDFYLVDFEQKEIEHINKGERVHPIKLKSL